MPSTPVPLTSQSTGCPPASSTGSPREATATPLPRRRQTRGQTRGLAGCLTGAAIAGFVATVVAANALTARYGLIPVGFGQTATAGTAAAGLTLLARDAVHHLTGRTAVIACIAAGAAVSAGLAGPRLAVASATAFALSELADMLIYQRLIRHGFISAAFTSNIFAAPVDSIVFLGLAGFPIWAALPGQLLVKTVTVTVTLALTTVPVAALAVAVRAFLRHRFRSSRS